MHELVFLFIHFFFHHDRFEWVLFPCFHFKYLHYFFIECIDIEVMAPGCLREASAATSSPKLTIAFIGAKSVGKTSIIRVSYN